MPLTSLQLYVHSILDGLVLPTSPPVKAYITPPVIDKLEGPRVYVWGGRLHGNRQTAPRRAAFKRLAWVVDVYVSYLTTADAGLRDQVFPQIVDGIMAATWQVEMPLMIDPNGVRVDPVNAPPNSTQITSIGEDFELEYPPERNAANLRSLYYTCRLGLNIEELVQG